MRATAVRGILAGVKTALFSLLVPSALALSACSTMYEVSAGLATVPRTDEHALAIEARKVGGGSEMWHAEVALRARLNTRNGQAASAFGLVLNPRPFAGNHFIFRLTGGFHTLELGYVNEHVSFGIGTPYLQSGFTWLPSPGHEVERAIQFMEMPSLPPSPVSCENYVTGVGLTLTAGVEYDVRWTSAQPNEFLWTVMIGVTFVRRYVGTTTEPEPRTLVDALDVPLCGG